MRHNNTNFIWIFFLFITANIHAQYTLTADDVNFDTETGTIINYKWPENVGTSIVIPDSIDGVAVTIIGLPGFVNPYFSTDSTSGLTSIVIPNSVTRIEQYAFAFNQINTLDIGESVKYIGKYAFESNDIENVVLPNSVEEIDTAAFNDNKISSITFPESFTVIRRMAFSGNNLSSLVLPSNLQRIEVDAFYHNNISNLDLPQSLTYLSGFRDNSFTEITIPSHVKEVGLYAFAQNPLVSVTFNEGLEYIGNQAFIVGVGVISTSLKSSVVDIQGTVVIPSTVKSIGDYAFRGNKDLTEVVFLDGLETIGTYAFGYCGLTEVDIPSSVTTIGSGAFAVNDIASVSLYDGLEEIKNSAFYMNDISTITIPGSVRDIGDRAFYGNSTMDTIIINNGVETIGEECFSYNQSVKRISLPISLLEIKENAFFNSFFTSFALPVVVKEGRAFSHWATYSGDSTNIIETVTKLSANDENGYIAIFSDAATGINTETENSLNYTNPVYSYFNINESGTIEIYNLCGCKILTQQVEKDSSVDLSFIPSGVYIFVLNKNVSGKFLKEP